MVFFATNAKMGLINDADIVLGVWFKVKKLNQPNVQFCTPYNRKRLILEQRLVLDRLRQNKLFEKILSNWGVVKAPAA